MLTINLRRSCVSRARWRAASRARAGSRYSACEWDDVAFRREDGKRFCSLRCALAFRADTTPVPDDEEVDPAASILDVDSRVSVALPRLPRRLLTLSQQEKRRSKRGARAVDISERRLELQSRVSDFFRPFRRPAWVGTNLAVFA